MESKTVYLISNILFNAMPGTYLRYLLLVLLSSLAIQLVISGFACAGEEQDFTVLEGEWVRPDGGYTLRLQEIKADGTVGAGYFNPSEIHVAEAVVSEWKGLIKFFIKLDDKGYPGSTYTLYYYAEKDALAGIYYQAAMRQTFEVIFFRK